MIEAFACYPSNIDPTTPLRFTLTADIPALALRAGSTGTVRRNPDKSVDLEFDTMQPKLAYWANTLTIYPDDPDAEIVSAVRIEYAPRHVKPKPIKHSCPWLAAVATLLITCPMVVLFKDTLGPYGAPVPFTVAVAWATSRFGWRGGLPLALASALAHNWFVGTPQYQFSVPHAVEYWYLSMWVFVSFTREAICVWENSVRPHIGSIVNPLLRRVRS